MNYKQKIDQIRKFKTDYFQKFDKPTLDLGCGDRPEHWQPSSVGMDMFDYRQAMVHDMTVTPWPIEDSQFDLVVAQHVLEHIRDGFDFINIMNEAHRVLKSGGVLKIAAPHFPSSPNYYRDPTHCRPLNEYSFEMFLVDSPIHVGHGYEITCNFRQRVCFTNPNRDLIVELVAVK